MLSRILWRASTDALSPTTASRPRSYWPRQQSGRSGFGKGTPLIVVLLLASLLIIPIGAQVSAPNPTQRKAPESQERVAVYRVTVVGRTIPAVNYRHRSNTIIDFHGTALLPMARGTAKIDSERGYTEVDVEFDDLQPAARFGPEYLTYVLWAITPEGRATNLGEVVLNGDEGKLEVTTELQSFGLIVTAEPYFAVTQPSDVVVMENVVRRDTKGKVDQVVAQYELLTRGTYLMSKDPSTLSVKTKSSRMPLDLLEARNAVQLSRFAAADEYAADTFQKASRLLGEAEDQYNDKKNSRTVSTTAREAVQVAEDARLIALKRAEDARIAREQAASAQREADARAQAALETERRARADADRRAAEEARLQAELAAQRTRAEADQAALINQRQIAESAAAREAAERARAEADVATQRLAQEKAAADAARAASQAEADRARQLAEQARVTADAAEKEKAELRARLQEQLNIILETRQTARGLIVNMSDVLFDTGKHTLRPGAREKLAKVAGILMTYPDLKLEIEGHTDSVGTDEYNEALSERRASTVRDFLVQQGIKAASVSARGFGESQPVVSNTTAAGRQQNRRVEMVVSGEAVGVGRLSKN